MNEVIKQRWVALGPRNYGKSIEWKLEGEPWDTEGLYADHTRGVYLLCLLLEAIQPLGWRLVSSAGRHAKLCITHTLCCIEHSVNIWHRDHFDHLLLLFGRSNPLLLADQTMAFYLLQSAFLSFKASFSRVGRAHLLR